MSDQQEKVTEAIGIINFHGVTLWVVECSGIEYVQAKPLVDLAQVDWRSAKKTLQEDHNLVLYGTKWLYNPVWSADSGTRTHLKESLYVRLDRSRLYMARINTRIMSSKGKVKEAERLLNLQIEWAQVLHDYETTGVATKDKKQADRREKEKSLLALMSGRKFATNQNERSALDQLIAERIDDLGIKPDELADDPQHDLGLQ